MLIIGESGAGKELVARAIHEHGPRAREPFVAINCSAIADTLLESELFGHQRGAFTGAVADHKGVFEQAGKGTVLLDEIGDTTPALQVRLLRVLEEGEVRPVGGTRTLKVSPRVIAATNMPLEQAVADGRFRQDLYYRLSVVVIRVPPLRDRRADIPLLIGSFLDAACERAGRKAVLSAAALEALMRHDWPGNVRELRNAIERLVVSSRGGVIEAADLSGADAASQPRLYEPVFANLTTLDELSAKGEFPRGLDSRRVAVELPRDPTHGDLSTNAAMVLAGAVKENPMVLAQRIAAALAGRELVTGDYRGC